MNKMQIGLVIMLILFAIAGSSAYFLVKRSGKRFIVAGKSLPVVFVGTMLFAQATEANGTLGGAGLAYSGGFWQGFSIAGGCGLAVLLTGMFFARPLNRMNLITLPDFYFRRYNNTVEILVSILSTVTFIIMGSLSIVGVGPI